MSSKNSVDVYPKMTDLMTPDGSLETNVMAPAAVIEQTEQDHEGSLPSHPEPAENDRKVISITQQYAQRVAQVHFNMTNLNHIADELSQLLELINCQLVGFNFFWLVVSASATSFWML